ncbi:MAG TPA: hypothetical protein VNQ99_00230 [Xanthobacteraceae bacterium]|nr:hypothetical protein [Xanthobacteraceae bacterium]
MSPARRALRARPDHKDPPALQDLPQRPLEPLRPSLLPQRKAQPVLRDPRAPPERKARQGLRGRKGPPARRGRRARPAPPAQPHPLAHPPRFLSVSRK